MSEVILSNIQVWRAKAADGTITLEEMRDAIAAIRKERVNASEKSATAKTRTATAAKKKAPINGESLLDELEGL